MAEEISPLEDHGWWMERLRKDAKSKLEERIMTEQPTALRLADALEGHAKQAWTREEAAAELRRLHHENERLHQINQSHEMKLSVRGYEIQIADLKAVNAELLEALKQALEECIWPSERLSDVCDKARAAIAKAEGQQ
jgi:hypothetical protein